MKPSRTKSTSSIQTLAKRLKRLFIERNLSLSTAESCTGGMIGAAITAIAGSSGFFKGGVVSYSNEMKHNMLGVPTHVLEKKGAVSTETVIAMAKGVQRLCRTDCGIAVSGIAGPGGGTKNKPVGLVYVGIAAGKKVRSFEYRFKGGRGLVRKQAVKEALQRMIEEATKKRQRDKETKKRRPLTIA